MQPSPQVKVQKLERWMHPADAAVASAAGMKYTKQSMQQLLTQGECNNMLTTKPLNKFGEKVAVQKTNDKLATRRVKLMIKFNSKLGYEMDC